MDQKLNNQFLIEEKNLDNKYEIAKGPSKALLKLPSIILNLPAILYSIREQIMLNTEIFMVMAKEYNAKIRLQKVTIFLHIDKKNDLCFLHNYTFYYNNSIKLDSTVCLITSQRNSQRLSTSCR